ncbi:DUF4279 domain-containing protein [Actinoplanes bogorensis]|uniref:DUF4279 domain-containing protein n=1 Tax=Paractinoplanes bogorensis TaxID=1610840 RepID=A0ABS5YQ71_9ACTN|nr:DUF4279 domain-containing protein [Actinoplanes bogorensis]MBU2665513.1 DUF4279 domain-containing protein [Actinoplanes bogorensis]
MTEDSPPAYIEAGCEQRAYLYVQRDYDPAGSPPYSAADEEQLAFDPQAVTELVGLTPTHAWRRGDVSHGGKRPPKRHSTWSYEPSDYTETFDTESVVTALLDEIEPYGEGLARARTQLGMRAGIMVVIWMRAGRYPDGEITTATVVISYRADTLQRLARLGLALVHDQYLELPDDLDDAGKG